MFRMFPLEQKRPKNLTDIINYPTIDIVVVFIEDTSVSFIPSTTLLYKAQKSSKKKRSGGVAVGENS